MPSPFCRESSSRGPRYATCPGSRIAAETCAMPTPHHPHPHPLRRAPARRFARPSDRPRPPSGLTTSTRHGARRTAYGSPRQQAATPAAYCNGGRRTGPPRAYTGVGARTADAGASWASGMWVPSSGNTPACGGFRVVCCDPAAAKSASIADSCRWQRSHAKPTLLNLHIAARRHDAAPGRRGAARRLNRAPW